MSYLEREIQMQFPLLAIDYGENGEYDLIEMDAETSHYSIVASCPNPHSILDIAQERYSENEEIFIPQVILEILELYSNEAYLKICSDIKKKITLDFHRALKSSIIQSMLDIHRKRKES